MRVSVIEKVHDPNKHCPNGASGHLYSRTLSGVCVICGRGGTDMNSENKRSIEEKMEADGWIVECEHPLEIRNNFDESFVTGYFAQKLIDSYKSTRRRKKHEETH